VKIELTRRRGGAEVRRRKFLSLNLCASAPLREIKFSFWLLLTVCFLAFDDGAVAQDKPRIVALLSADRASYREHLAKFEERLSADVTTFILPADPAELTPKIEAASPALLLALGTPAAKYAASLGPTTPVVFAMIYDPAAAGLPSGPNQCGTRLRVPMEQAAEALAALRPGGKNKLTIGVLHDPVADASELDELRPAIAARGWPLVVEEAPSPDRLKPALAKLLPRIDVLWIVMEPSLIPLDQDALREKLLRPAMDAKVAVVGVSDWQVEKGALLAVSVDYAREGAHTAKLAARVLKGEAPAKIGVEGPENVDWSLNLKVAAELGWEVPPLTRKRFEKVHE
jgi:putative tryptophan/tyrosine transport system substrate-binding protein